MYSKSGKPEKTLMLGDDDTRPFRLDGLVRSPALLVPRTSFLMDCVIRSVLGSFWPPDEPDTVATLGITSPFVAWSPLEMMEASPNGALSAFIKLANGSPAQVFAFLKRYGPLVIDSPILSRIANLEADSTGSKNYHVDTIASWISTARRFRSFLQLQFHLEHGMVPSEEDWGEILQPDNPRSFRWTSLGKEFCEKNMELRIGQEKKILAFEVNRLLESGKIIPVVEWTEKTSNSRQSLQIKLQSLRQATSKARNGVTSEFSKGRWEELCSFLQVGEENLAYSSRDTAEQWLTFYRLYSVLVIQLVAAMTSALLCCEVCGELYSPDSRKPRRRIYKNSPALCGPECGRERTRANDRKTYAEREVAGQKKKRKLRGQT